MAQDGRQKTIFANRTRFPLPDPLPAILLDYCTDSEVRIMAPRIRLRTSESKVH
jgi:hypothetical protein